jgi:thiol-disulfide isomerase/thioredoxin
MKSRKHVFNRFSFPVEFCSKKQLWANLFLMKSAELVVEEWISLRMNIKGKFILIDAAWCGPCIRQRSKLNAFHEKFKDGLVVIGISDESKEKINNFKKVKIDYYELLIQMKHKNIYSTRSIVFSDQN